MKGYGGFKSPQKIMTNYLNGTHTWLKYSWKWTSVLGEHLVNGLNKNSTWIITSLNK